MRRFLLGVLLVCGLAAPVAAEEVLPERVLGAADAPVTMLEFSSLTCPHCANFHAETLPKIREAYIDTGKVRLVYHDFPFDRAALSAGMVARCVAAEKYFGFLEVLFRSQPNWSRQPDPVPAITQMARFAGLPRAEVEACLENKALADAILQTRLKAQNDFGINSTPSFIINGTKVTGALPFAEFQKVIDAALP